ncbi:hypothetical protein R6Q57_015989 [Mikania cordata]
MNRAKSASGGDETPVDEVEVLERTLEANARWEEQQRINETMQQQINKLMSMQGQGSSSFYYPEHPQDEDEDHDKDEDEDDESD